MKATHKNHKKERKGRKGHCGDQKKNGKGFGRLPAVDMGISSEFKPRMRISVPPSFGGQVDTNYHSLCAASFAACCIWRKVGEKVEVLLLEYIEQKDGRRYDPEYRFGGGKSKRSHFETFRNTMEREKATLTRLELAAQESAAGVGDYTKHEAHVKKLEAAGPEWETLCDETETEIGIVFPDTMARQPFHSEEVQCHCQWYRVAKDATKKHKKTAFMFEWKEIESSLPESKRRLRTGADLEESQDEDKHRAGFEELLKPVRWVEAREALDSVRPKLHPFHRRLLIKVVATAVSAYADLDAEYRSLV